MLLNVILSITYSGLLSFLALFGDYVHIEQVGLFFLFNAITIILVRPFSGRIFDKRGHVAVLLPAGLSVMLSMVLLSSAHAMPMLILSALLYGLGFGAIQPTIQAWMLRSSSPEQYGAVKQHVLQLDGFRRCARRDRAGSRVRGIELLRDVPLLGGRHGRVRYPRRLAVPRVREAAQTGRGRSGGRHVRRLRPRARSISQNRRVFWLSGAYAGDTRAC